MAQARREERRQLALDVRGLIWFGRLDTDRYIKTGSMVEWVEGGEIPDTPVQRQAAIDLEREREYHRQRGIG